MNFLAHIFLSGENEEIQVGNFMGDFVKGSDLSRFPASIQTGIALHRSIDHFTDHHAQVKKSKKRLVEKYGHYAGVIVDMYYDHFLAKNFQRIADVSLQVFTNQFYARIRRHMKWLPKNLERVLFYMEKDNWLYHYQYIDGIDRALSGLSRRTKFESGMDQASVDLQAQYDSFASDFELFFPELQSHTQEFLQTK